MKVLNNIDLNKNELQNARIQNLGTAPATPVEGQVYHNTSDHRTYIWNGTAWVYFIPSGMAGSGNGLDADKLDGQEGSYYLNRANHSGTQAASTISDFDTQVRTSRLDQMAAPTASVSVNNQNITNLLDPVNPQDAATKNYVDSTAQGLDTKASVKIATTEDITLSGEQTIDDVAIVAGDRVLVKNQNTQSSNGIYIAASGAWARSTDTNSWDKLIAAYAFVEEGSINADTGWVSTANSGGTLGVTPIIWAQFNGASGSSTASNVGTSGVGVFKQKTGNDLELKKIAAGSNKVTITDNTTNSTLDIDVVVANLGIATKYTTLVGNGSSTSIVVTHSLNSRDVSVTIRETTAPYALVFTDCAFTDANNVTLQFATAPTTDQYTVTVIG
jgi:hypothetical protein